MVRPDLIPEGVGAGNVGSIPTHSTRGSVEGEARNRVLGPRPQSGSP
jgi:hypothetical protein